jgi:hypothetical protein
MTNKSNETSPRGPEGFARLRGLGRYLLGLTPAGRARAEAAARAEAEASADLASAVVKLNNGLPSRATIGRYTRGDRPLITVVDQGDESRTWAYRSTQDLFANDRSFAIERERSLDTGAQRSTVRILNATTKEDRGRITTITLRQESPGSPTYWTISTQEPVSGDIGFASNEPGFDSSQQEGQQLSLLSSAQIMSQAVETLHRSAFKPPTI